MLPPQKTHIVGHSAEYHAMHARHHACVLKMLSQTSICISLFVSLLHTYTLYHLIENAYLVIGNYLQNTYLSGRTSPASASRIQTFIPKHSSFDYFNFSLCRLHGQGIHSKHSSSSPILDIHSLRASRFVLCISHNQL